MFDDSKKLSDFMKQAPAVKGVKKIIAVASAKGGVGKSTIACHLAHSLSKSSKNVALVDADIYGPSIPYIMGLSGKPKHKDGMVLPMISNNIKCMSVGLIIKENEAGVWRGPMVSKILHQLIRSVNWQYDQKGVDVMIIDMPPGTGDIYLSLAHNFPLAGVVIVSTPQNLAIIDVVRSIDCFRKLEIPILGLVENMSYFEINNKKEFPFGKNSAVKLAKKEGIKFLGQVPFNDELNKSAQNFITKKKKLITIPEIEHIAKLLPT